MFVRNHQPTSQAIKYLKGDFVEDLRESEPDFVPDDGIYRVRHFTNFGSRQSYHEFGSLEEIAEFLVAVTEEAKNDRIETHISANDLKLIVSHHDLYTKFESQKDD